MKKWVGVTAAIAMAAGIALPAAPGEVLAKEESHHEFSIKGFTDYAELTKKLQQIEQTSKGLVSVDVAGQSNQGRDIYTVRVGSGDKVVLIQSEIHGNEKTGTDAILNLLKTVSGGSPYAQQLREEITFVFMPMMNPDASEGDKRRNTMTWAEVVEDFPQLSSAQPSWNYLDDRIQQNYDYSKNPGFDVNRDFNPDLDYVPQPEDFPGSSGDPGWFITPESQTSRDVYKSLVGEFGKVDVFIDLHHQGVYYVDGTSDEVTLSLSAQFVPDPSSPEGADYAQYADNYNYDFSRQLNVAAYDALQAKGNSIFNNITLYSQGLDLPGTALGSYALNGSGTVLFEVKGQTQSYGQKKRGQLVKAVETGLLGIVNAVADGSVHDLNPEDYEDIPLTAYRPAE